MKKKAYCIVMTTVDSQEIAEKITTALLKARLVACVQAQTVQSSYHWNSQIETSTEILLQMKTKSLHFDNIEHTIKDLHTYDIPEIIMLPIQNANRDYLTWIDREVK
jgi:periplasmic divalent cation tolerance protein